MSSSAPNVSSFASCHSFSLSPPPASFGSHPPEERGPDAGVLVGGVGREECLRAMVERGATVVRAARFDSSGPVVRADVSGYGGKEEFLTLGAVACRNRKGAVLLDDSLYPAPMQAVERLGRKHLTLALCG